MVDIFGNDLASSVDELHMSKLDDNIQKIHMIDELGAKVKEVDEALTEYNTTLDGKIWGLGSKIENSTALGSKILDLETIIPKNYETLEYGEKQEPEGDGSYWEMNHETGINKHIF